MKRFLKTILSLCLAASFVVASLPSVSAANAGGSCSRLNAISGTTAKPLVCKMLNGKMKWVLAPGGSCQSLGAMSGTASKPRVCQKVAGKLRWVEVNGLLPTTTTENTKAPKITQPVLTTNTTLVPAPLKPTLPKFGTPWISTTTLYPTTTIPVVCPSNANLFNEITSATDVSYRTTGTANVLYYYTRNVQGVIRNNSSVAVKVINAPVMGKTTEIIMGTSRDQNQKFVGTPSGVTIEAGGVFSWSFTYETGGHPAVSQNGSPVVRSEWLSGLMWISLNLSLC